MRKILVALLGAGLLVGAGVVYTVASSDSSAAVAQEQESTTDGTTDDAVVTQADETDDLTDDAADDDATDRPQRLRRGEVMNEVLDGLVADGVITQEQADRIVADLSARLEELRAEFRAQREELADGTFSHRIRGFGRFGFGDLLEDGVIDADELAELGEGHPLNDPDGPAAEYLDDGQLTEDELTEMMEELRSGRFGGEGSRFGNPLDTDDADAVESSFSA